MRIVRLILLLPLAALLLVLSTLALAWSIRMPANMPFSQFLLSHPSQALGLAMARMRETGKATRDDIVAARLLLAEAPLQAQPFVLEALVTFQDGDYARARQLLAMARKRDPRSIEGRLLSADVALAEGDVAGAVDDLETLLRIVPDQPDLANEALALLATEAETRSAALGAVTDKRLSAQMLAALARSGPPSAELLQAIDIAQAKDRSPWDAAAVGAIIAPSVAAGDFAAAYAVWARLQPGAARQPALIRDGTFAAGQPAPFGWELRSGADGFVEAGPGGLSGEVFGRTSAILARQLLLLGPGPYRLYAQIAEPNELVEVMLSCPSGAEVTRLRLDKAGQLFVAFVVPGDCAAQWIEVRARASDPPQPGAFTLKAIDIVGQGQ